ncbi:MAG: PQQ-dependent sugar dehydrogenase [Gemmatimonadales bacterium]
MSASPGTDPPDSSVRTLRGRSPIGAIALWYAAAFALVLLLPAQWRLGQPFWLLPPPQVPQVLVWGAAFLALALLTMLIASRNRSRAAVTALIAAPLIWMSGYLLLIALPEVQVSRVVAGTTGILSVALVLIPLLRESWVRGGGLVVAVLTVASVTLARATPADVAVESSSLRAALHPIQITFLRDVVGTGGTDGGAVAALGDGFLHVNGAGEFSRLDWDTTGTTLLARRVPLTPPLDRPGFLATQPDSGTVHSFRVTDLLLGPEGTPRDVLVAHTAWHPAEQCLTLRVSRTQLRLDLSPGDEPPAWELVFETSPCHPIGLTIRVNQTGGQLAWLGPDSLLVTVGDHGFEGQSAPAFAQDTAADYGKVILIEPNGTARHWTMGHRNPQGLVVAADGRIWVSDQGPQGGDEINLLREGANFGWPLVTYGTNYGSTIWPFNEGRRNHGEFTEPAYVFVPSPAISSIMQVRGSRLARWQGDLLLGSLRGRSLFRLRTRDDRVSYAEAIPVGERIRDLAEGADGRILIWTDSGALVILADADPEQDGRLAYGACGDCHSPDLRGTDRGPPLRGVFGRRIAGWPGYPFSPALRRWSGEWTAERLDAFLADPQGFAPGTTMELAPMTNAAERRVLIEYLRRQ